MSGRPKKKSEGLSFEELRRRIDSGQIDPLYLFTGDEQYYHERALRLLYDGIDPGLRAFNASVFSIGSDNGYGSKTTAAHAVDAANQMPMMSPRRIVVIREFDKIKEDEQDSVLAYLKRPSPTTTLIFQASAPDKRRKLTTALLKSCVVATFEPLDDGRAARWVTDYLKSLHCGIDPDALRLLIALVGTRLTRLVNELEKLIAYADGVNIDSAAVQELVPRAREHTSWELWDAIISRDRKRALKLMGHLLEDSDPLPILGSLASLYRRMLIGKELVDRGASSQEIVRATGQYKPAFVAELRRTPQTQIARGLRRIAEVDNAIKNSEGTPRLQMEYLIAELTLPATAR